MAEPEGEAWLSTKIPMATVHQLIYIPSLISQWLLSIETNSTLIADKIELNNLLIAEVSC